MSQNDLFYHPKSAELLLHGNNLHNTNALVDSLENISFSIRHRKDPDLSGIPAGVKRHLSLARSEASKSAVSENVFAQYSDAAHSHWVLARNAMVKSIANVAGFNADVFIEKIDCRTQRHLSTCKSTTNSDEQYQNIKKLLLPALENMIKGVPLHYEKWHSIGKTLQMKDPSDLTELSHARDVMRHLILHVTCSCMARAGIAKNSEEFKELCDRISKGNY